AAVTLVAPTASAVATPVWLTLATTPLPTDHVASPSGSAVPSASSGETLKPTDSPSALAVKDDGALDADTATCFTVTASDAVIPSIAAVIVADPFPLATSE